MARLRDVPVISIDTKKKELVTRVRIETMRGLVFALLCVTACSKPGYGCPGCTDGPTHEVVIHDPEGWVHSHALDPMRPDQAPPILVEASALIEAFSAALYRCEASELFQPAPDCKQIMEVEIKRPSGIP